MANTSADDAISLIDAIPNNADATEPLEADEIHSLGKLGDAIWATINLVVVHLKNSDETYEAIKAIIDRREGI